MTLLIRASLAVEFGLQGTHASGAAAPEAQETQAQQLEPRLR